MYPSAKAQAQEHPWVMDQWTNGPSPPATEKIPKSEDSWLVCKLPGEEPQLRSTLVQETSIPTRLEQSERKTRKGMKRT